MIALIAGMAGCGSNGGSDNGGESYALSIDSTAGGVVTVDNVTIPGKTSFAYDAGTVVSLNATPDSGYEFVRWTGDVGTVDNVHASETTITMNGNYYIVANFQVPAPVQYMLAILSSAGGSVIIPGEGSFTYDAGMVVNLVATPASRYKFFKWSGDVDTIADVNAASTNITMSGNYTTSGNYYICVCANFREAPTLCTSLG
jgi:Divergent InlB B-repeat domain